MENQPIGANAAQQPLPRKTPTFLNKLAYASGDVLGGGAFGIISLLYLSYLTIVEGISPAVAGTMILVGKIWDAVIDPVIGALSDNTRSRFGRRRIWFLIGIAPVFVSFFMLWYSFGITGMTAKIIYNSMAYMLFSAAFSIVTVPYYSLLSDMTESYNERTSFMAVRFAVSIGSVIMSFLLSRLLVGNVTGAENARGFVIMGLVLGAIYALPWLFTAFGTYERPLPPNLPKTSVTQTFKDYAGLFKNKSFRHQVGMFITGQAATDIMGSLANFMIIYVFVRTSGVGTILTAIPVAMEILSLPINVLAARKLGKNAPTLINFPIRIIALLCFFFVGVETPIMVLYIVAVFVGFGQSASSFVPHNILPDITDVDEAMCGKRREGIYSGATAFLRQLTGGLAIFAAGVLIELFGFVSLDPETGAAPAAQSASAVLGLKLTYIVVPVILCAITLFFAARYKLSAKNYALLRAAIDKKHADPKARFDAETINAVEQVSGQAFETLWLGDPDAE